KRPHAASARRWIAVRRFAAIGGGRLPQQQTGRADPAQLVERSSGARCRPVGEKRLSSLVVVGSAGDRAACAGDRFAREGQHTMNAVLALEDGTWYRGMSAGAPGEAQGE